MSNWNLFSLFVSFGHIFLIYYIEVCTGYCCVLHLKDTGDFFISICNIVCSFLSPGTLSRSLKENISGPPFVQNPGRINILKSDTFNIYKNVINRQPGSVVWCVDIWQNECFCPSQIERKYHTNEEKRSSWPEKKETELLLFQTSLKYIFRMNPSSYD